MNILHTWLITHPIARELIFGALFVIAAYYITPLLATSKRFLSIPPQHLNIRILKARLSYAESNLENFYALHNNLRYFILSCLKAIISAFLAAMIIITTLQMVTLVAIIHQVPHKKIFSFVFQYVAIPVAYLLFLSTGRGVFRIATAVGTSRYYETVLKEKRNHLKVKLLDKGIS